MRKRVAMSVAVLGACGLAGAAIVHNNKPGAIVSIVSLDDPPTDVTVDARSGHAVVTAQPEAIVAAHLGTIRTWVLDPRDGHVTATRVAPNPLYLCHNYVSDHWPNVWPMTTPCARAILAFTPQDTVTHRAFLTGVEYVVVVDTRTGTAVALEVDVFSQPQDPIVNEQIHRAYVSIGSDRPGGQTMWVWDTRTGRVLSIVGFQGLPSTPLVAVRTNRVFVPAHDDITSSPPLDRIYTLDARTNRVRQMVVLRRGQDTRGVVWAGAAARANHVFAIEEHDSAASYDVGTVFMLDASSGAIIRTVDVGLNPLMGAVDEQRGRVYVLSRGPLTMQPDRVYTSGYAPVGVGSVSVLDAASGQVLRTIPVGVDPHSLAVDGHTGHVIVVAGGGTIDAPDADPWAWAPGWLRQRLPFMARPRQHWRHVKPTVTVLDATN